MATGSGWNPDLMDVRWSEVCFDAKRAREKRYPLLIIEKDSSKSGAGSQFPDPQGVKTSEVGTLGPMAEVEQHVTHFFTDDPIKGYSKETKYKKFGIQVVFTEEALDDDLFGITDQYAGQIGDS